MLDKNDGEIDSQVVEIGDIIGKKMRFGPKNPHIWDERNRIGWYGYHPTDADYKALGDVVRAYEMMYL